MTNTGKPWNRLKGSRGESPRFILRLPPGLMKELKAQAKREGRSASELIRNLIEKHLKRKRK